MSKNGKKSVWQPVGVQNLVRYSPTGMYYARYKIGGKLFRQNLHTTVKSVAKLLLSDFLKEKLGKEEKGSHLDPGKMTFQNALEVYQEKIDADGSLKPRSKEYRKQTIGFLLKTWPGIQDLNVREIQERDCVQWLARFQDKYAPSVVNNTIGTLRNIFKVAIQVGARFGNPANELKRVRINKKKMTLPSRVQFLKLVETMMRAGGRDSQNCADLVRFLAYSGLRIGESKHVTWRDIDFVKKKLHVRGDPITGTKNSETRMVPMIAELETMLEKMRHERSDESPDKHVMNIHECQKSMDRAAKIVGMERITHHDLRHLFATICIESGVDIPTVSRWLGHKDGGALAMKVYGHLRDEHSAAQAQRVRFDQ
jgi:integrase